jgi:hypothetical protein
MSPDGAPFERSLRANPAFELVLFDRLPEGERRLLAGLARDPDHYGVLRPRGGSGLGMKAIDRETALLFLTLGRPGPLPRYVRSRLGDEAALAAVGRLVADGVLEIELEAGRFHSGAAAMPALVAAVASIAAAGSVGLSAAALPAAPEEQADPVAAAVAGRLTELSFAALRYGQELARTRPAAQALWLSLRLYGYHRRPLTPRWRRALPSTEAVRGYLRIDPGGAWHGLLQRYWREQEQAAPAGAARGAGSAETSSAETSEGPQAPEAPATPQAPEAARAPQEAWLQWRPRRERAVKAGPGPNAHYKLYVSPATDALPESFGRVLDGLAAAGAPHFKVGATAGGLLRPDKVVAYFDSFEGLAEAAAAVGERLAGLAAALRSGQTGG